MRWLCSCILFLLLHSPLAVATPDIDHCLSLLLFFHDPRAPSLADPLDGRAPLGTPTTISPNFVFNSDSEDSWVRLRDGRMELHRLDGNLEEDKEVTLITPLGETRRFQRSVRSPGQWEELPPTSPQNLFEPDPLTLARLRELGGHMENARALARRWHGSSASARARGDLGIRLLLPLAHDFGWVVARGKPMRREDLERWNELARRAYRTTARDPGLVRGWNYAIPSNVLDYPIFFGNDSLIFLQFVAPEHVPSRLEALLARVNQVDQNTAIIEIAAIFQEFLVIHPFTDGNGRVARALRDYSILRAGLPPLPNTRALSDSLYRTPADYAARMLAAYAPLLER